MAISIIGTALVRNVPVNTTPLPSTLALFATGLVALAAFRRRRSRGEFSSLCRFIF